MWSYDNQITHRRVVPLARGCHAQCAGTHSTGLTPTVSQPADAAFTQFESQKCVDVCIAQGGPSLPAVVLGDICGCISYEDIDFPALSYGSTGTCDVPCTGDDSLTCGGSTSFELYEVVPMGGVSGAHGERRSYGYDRLPVLNYLYDGCYRMSEVPPEPEPDGVFSGPEMTPVVSAAGNVDVEEYWRHQYRGRNTNPYQHAPDVNATVSLGGRSTKIES